MTRKIIIILFCFLNFLAFTQENNKIVNSKVEPVVTNVSGTVVHDGTLSISGNNFDTKNPITPLWWDNGECADTDTVNPSVMNSGELEHVVSTFTGNDKHYNDVMPRTLASDSLEMQYLVVDKGILKNRGVGSPHSFSSRILGGGHDDEGECLGGEPGQSVAINVTAGNPENEWFVMYYRRLDPAWPPWEDGHNWKEFDWEDEYPYTIFFGSDNTYDNVNSCGGGYNNLRRAPSCGDSWMALAIIQLFTLNVGNPSNGGYPVITHSQEVSNPYNGWVHTERRLSSNPELYQILHDNVYAVDTNLDPDGVVTFTAGPFAAVTIGSFWRKAHCGNNQDDLDDDARRYFDDVYIDNTFSRVILGDAPIYSDCRIVEPQIPLTWSTTSISVRVNIGKLSISPNIYLYVFNANNECNLDGKLILGTGQPAPSEPKNPKIEKIPGI